MSFLKEKCGIFGVYNGPEAARLTYFGLIGLQHRGQDGSGIAASNGGRIIVHKDVGLVDRVYTEEDIEKFDGCTIAIGHNRYRTSGPVGKDHVQPVSFHPELALAHNGNLPDVSKLLAYLDEKGTVIEGRNDSELMYEAIYYNYRRGGKHARLADAVHEVLPLFTGAYSLLVMSRDELVAVRDGTRPLSIGEFDNGHYVISSETCAIDTVQARSVRDIRAGEMVVINRDGMQSWENAVNGREKMDAFEFVYFSRPDSILLGKRVAEVRRQFGIRLNDHKKLDADVIIPVPDSSIPAAEGLSEASGIPMRQGLIKNRYIGRTFISPGELLRDRMARMKYNHIEDIIRGQRVILLDDSIVRLNTAPRLVKRMLDAGAVSVDFMVASAPILHPDFYGIDLGDPKELVAARMTVEEMREQMGARSLIYLPYNDMIDAIGVPEDLLHTACWTGNYHIPLGKSAETALPTGSIKRGKTFSTFAVNRA